MGKEIKTTPEAIRSAGTSISGLDVKSSYSSFPTELSSSDGLFAEGTNEIIAELAIIEGLISGIISQFPKKLESVASIIEGYDNAAASQFE